MPTPLAIYLRNHEAAAQAGHDLFQRVARSHRRQPYGVDLTRLAAEVEADLRSLRRILRRHHVLPDARLGLALRAGERLGRLKPNGSLLQRAPLTDLIEIEGLLDAVRAKAAGWQALAAAGTPPESVEFETLLDRANSQASELVEIHRRVAAQVLDLG